VAIRINLTVNQNGKKNIYLTTLLLGFLIISQPPVNRQEKKKVIDRPSTCDVKNIDDFVSKTFYTYDKSQKISEDLRFIKMEDDEKTDPIKVTNGKRESISKETALVQFGDLLVRAKKQNDNIKTLQ